MMKTSPFLPILAVLGVLIGCMAWWVLAQHPSYLDAAGHYYGQDFINYWAAPQIARHDVAALFSIPDYNQAVEKLYGESMAAHVWSYPPQALLLFAPFSLASLKASFALWTLAGLGLFFFCAYRAAPAQPRLALLLTCFAPATLLNGVYGQNGFFTAALTLGALWLLQKRPALSGMLLGLLTFKPQLGIIWPFLLIVQRQWRTIVIAVLTAAALVAVSMAVYGIAVWQQFFAVTVQWSADFIRTPPQNRNYEVMMVSFPLTLQQLGLGTVWAFRLQFLLAVGIVITLAMALRHKLPFSLLALLVTSGALLMTPYGFNYDMTAFSAVLAWRFVGGPLSDRQKLVYGIGYLLPGLVYWLYFFLPVAPFLLLAVYVSVLRESIHTRPDK